VQIKTRNRLTTILIIFSLCIAGVYFILSNLSDNIVFFHPPSEIDKIQSNSHKVRVGGVVKENSIIRLKGNKISFVITDHIADLKIEFTGLLPALFREKQGIVAEGRLVDKQLFIAEKLLAKHDENYTPPELARLELKK
jgi:cytochrome c-type biogenesis protein CcmE